MTNKELIAQAQTLSNALQISLLALDIARYEAGTGDAEEAFHISERGLNDIMKVIDAMPESSITLGIKGTVFSLQKVRDEANKN